MNIYVKESIGNASTELEMECETLSEALGIIRVVFERERLVENTLHPNYKIDTGDWDL